MLLVECLWGAGKDLMSNVINFDETRKLELNLLVEFAKFCERENLNYYLAYGTLIGAIRHKGFIPWDNDVDVVMPRPDYTKFLKRIHECPINDYIEALDYHEKRTFPFVKLIDSRTRLKEHFLVTEQSLGIYIDIFPLDGFPDAKEEQHRLFKKAVFYYKLFAFANYRFNTGANLGKRMAKIILYPFSRLISSYKVCERLNQLCEAYHYDDSNMVGNVVWGFDEREIISKTCFGKASGEFEGHQFCIPSGYDQYLKQGYGEYMQIPPEEERVTHQFLAEWKDEIVGQGNEE